MSEIERIQPEEAKAMVKEGRGVFIDIRTISEALLETLEGSLFLPFDLINKERLQDLGIEEKMPIIVCRSGIRAAQAAEALQREGGAVAIMEGGMDRWKKRGLATRRGGRSIPLERQVLIGAGGMILLFTLLGLMVSSIWLSAAILMCCGMIFAGITGACGMARVLVMMPWNRAPLCDASCTTSDDTGTGSNY